MNRVYKFMLGVGILLGLSGCAMVPESIDLKPVVNTSTSNIGQDQKVAVQVVDARPEKTLGGRATYIGGAADINLANDPAVAAEKVIFKGLKNYGFEPVQYSADPACSRSMKLSITDLQYQEISHPFSMDIAMSSTIQIKAANDGESYENTYNKQKVHPILMAPLTSQDQTDINNVFSDNLRQILNDKKLLKFLAN